MTLNSTSSKRSGSTVGIVPPHRGNITAQRIGPGRYSESASASAELRSGGWAPVGMSATPCVAAKRGGDRVSDAGDGEVVELRNDRRGAQERDLLGVEQRCLAALAVDDDESTAFQGAEIVEAGCPADPDRDAVRGRDPRQQLTLPRVGFERMHDDGWAAAREADRVVAVGRPDVDDQLRALSDRPLDDRVQLTLVGAEQLRDERRRRGVGVGQAGERATAHRQPVPGDERAVGRAYAARTVGGLRTSPAAQQCRVRRPERALCDPLRLRAESHRAGA